MNWLHNSGFISTSLPAVLFQNYLNGHISKTAASFYFRHFCITQKITDTDNARKKKVMIWETFIKQRKHSQEEGNITLEEIRKLKSQRLVAWENRGLSLSRALSLSSALSRALSPKPPFPPSGERAGGPIFPLSLMKLNNLPLEKLLVPERSVKVSPHYDRQR